MSESALRQFIIVRFERKIPNGPLGCKTHDPQSAELAFGDAGENRLHIELDDIKLNVKGRNDLIVNKRACGCPKDIADAESLDKTDSQRNGRPAAYSWVSQYTKQTLFSFAFFCFDLV